MSRVHKVKSVYLSSVFMFNESCSFYIVSQSALTKPANNFVLYLSCWRFSIKNEKSLLQLRIILFLPISFDFNTKPPTKVFK